MELKEGKGYLYTEPIELGRRELVCIHSVINDCVWFEGMTIPKQKCTVKEFKERAVEFKNLQVKI